MKLGLLTADIGYIERAARLGFEAIELTTDALGDPARGDLDTQAIEDAANLLARHDIEISALA